MKGHVRGLHRAFSRLGDRVKVKPGIGHDAMTMGKTGTVKEVGSPALGIRFDGMSKLHKWYVDQELERASR